MREGLSNDAADDCRICPFASPPRTMWRQKLDIERRPRVAEVVVRDRWTVVTEKLLDEAVIPKSFEDDVVLHDMIILKSDVGVCCEDRLVPGNGNIVEPVQPMSPTAHDQKTI